MDCDRGFAHRPGSGNPIPHIGALFTGEGVAEVGSDTVNSVRQDTSPRSRSAHCRGGDTLRVTRGRIVP